MASLEEIIWILNEKKRKFLWRFVLELRLCNGSEFTSSKSGRSSRLNHYFEQWWVRKEQRQSKISDVSPWNADFIVGNLHICPFPESSVPSRIPSNGHEKRFLQKVHVERYALFLETQIRRVSKSTW